MATPSPAKRNGSDYDARLHHRDRDLDSQPQPPAVAVSLLQPRVAVALGVPKRWHHTLSACRLLSMFPSFWWGIRLVARFLLAEMLRVSNRQSSLNDSETTRRLTETALAAVWCGASAYLAFFFTDCLMSRWLINYTPHATVVRLCTISCVFAYLTSWVVYLTGGTEDPGLLLPAWIVIATILTTCYHFTQRKIKIRKETFASISMFSVASFISMVALLLHSHFTRLEAPHVPLVAFTKRTCEVVGHFVIHVLGVKYDMAGL
ncbi:Uu.00g113090.m01.CDS01 [Anthostomella pinea]|uniref:Uu.00g113090.m01.CDS01 n=1 Tax=Anthostomella pinea TaxID=933095 RepID=A0AAI8YGF1_9PEZI|nr:Uu.00g113090.m01.CDS01 [Anthostomella pinea]